jgi:nitroimidazol reductase NimA-like FMN-containing flavoprotein (pyridoxamine 5'-phosphate oxidase superfamily)
MRKAQREITEFAALHQVVESCLVCRIAFQTGGAPYIVPMNFGLAVLEERGLRLYMHCALEGRKLDLLHQDPIVGFEMDRALELITAPRPCGYSQTYESVIGEGVLRIVESEEERVFGLSRLMEHYGARGLGAAGDYDPAALALTCVLALDVTAISGKHLTA